MNKRRIMFSLGLVLVVATGMIYTSSRTPAVPPWDQPSSSAGVIHPGDPASAGMMREPLDAIDHQVQTAIHNKVTPGAVVLIARHGTIAKLQAYGYAAEYTDARFTPLATPVPMRTDTMFDVASVSKLFTATAVMQLCDQGKIHLDDPVAKYLPEFAKGGKGKVTIRQLLTHTSGFEPAIPLWQISGTRNDRMEAVLTHPLSYPPGTKYVYSDLNLITLGALVERLTGQRLDAYVHDHITVPLHMTDTMYNPPAYLRWRIAATEYQTSTNRGLVWGQVQDENSWALGGVAGHAGVFSTAKDLAVFAQMMLDGGIYNGKRILSGQAVKLMEENQLPKFPGDHHGLGWELDQGWYMDALGDAKTMGHTGFTGTSIVVSPDKDTICIVLTNRVHPTRNTVSTNALRRLVARQAALAIPVVMPWKDGAWFAGVGDNQNHTLSKQVSLPKGGTLQFNTWYRTELKADYGYVEVTKDGAKWTRVASFTGESDWTSKSCKLPSGTTEVRFRYHTDATVNGRGWYVHDPTVLDNAGKPVPGGSWTAKGWSHQDW